MIEDIELIINNLNIKIKIFGGNLTTIYRECSALKAAGRDESSLSLSSTNFLLACLSTQLSEFEDNGLHSLKRGEVVLTSNRYHCKDTKVSIMAVTELADRGLYNLTPQPHVPVLMVWLASDILNNQIVQVIKILKPSAKLLVFGGQDCSRTERKP